jgi:hypothetical protein
LKPWTDPADNAAPHSCERRKANLFNQAPNSLPSPSLQPLIQYRCPLRDATQFSLRHCLLEPTQ